MDDIQQFSSLVGSFYDCASESTRWQRTLQALCDKFQGRLATLSVYDRQIKAIRFGAWCGDPEVVLPLVTKYAAHMPLFDAISRMEVDVPNTLQDLFDLHGPDGREVYENSILFKEWAVPHGVSGNIGVTVLKQQSRIGSLVVAIDKHRPPVSQQDMNFMALLAPHIRRAVTISDLFEADQRETNIFRGVINNLAFVVFIVGGDMKLQYANPVAETLLRDGMAVRLPANTLSFVSPLAHAAITNAVATGQRDEVALGTAGIGVPLAPVQKPAVAHVLPLVRRADAGSFTSQSAAAIFVAAAGTNIVPSIETIAALFGLTAAEKKVASQIANGMTRAEIAAASGIADSTVKTQLTTLYDKTNTKGQRELELLIRELTPPVKPETQWAGHIPRAGDAQMPESIHCFA